LFENFPQRFDGSLIFTLTGQIGKHIEDVGAIIENLLSIQSGGWLTVLLKDSTVPFGTSTDQSGVTQCIVDEI